MKDILIVLDSLSTGGLEKTLIDLCNNIDYTKYNVDVYLFNDGRDLVPQLNSNVNLLPDSPYYSTVFNQSVFQSLKTLIRQKRIDLALYRIIKFMKARFGISHNWVFDWYFQKKTMLKIDKQYDVAIGFAERTACYYVADCVNAKVKNMWIHTDIKEIGSNRILDNMAFEKANNICTVSQNSRKSLEELYPQYKSKIKVFTLPSLFDFDRIEALATALSVSPSYLFGWDKENTPDERQLTEGEWAMIKIFRLIPEDQQKAFLEMEYLPHWICVLKHLLH